MPILNNNIEALKKRYPLILDEVLKIEPDPLNYQVEAASNGLKTLRVEQDFYGENKKNYIHSKYNPVVEAQKFAKEQYKCEMKVHILYGFGLGYHVEEICKIMNPGSKLYVLENNLNVFYKALEERDLTDIIANPCIELIVSCDPIKIADQIKELIDGGINFIIHPASLKVIPSENEYFKFIMENWNLKKSISEDFLNMIDENLKINLKRNSPNVGVFFDKFIGLPAIIVSAGPSLDTNIDYLREAKNRALIIAVGSALRPLLIKNIIPDFFVIIDPQKETIYQIKGLEDIKIPMIYLASAAAFTVSYYSGLKFIACSSKAQLKAEEEKYLVASGGSVATTALDIAIKMGCGPIVLVGQDLAFVKGKNHAEYGTHSDINSPELKNMRRVLGQNGDMLYTTLGLLSFKYWIESRIENESRQFINATEGGAFINGMLHIKLKDVIADYLKKSFDISKRIKTILEESGNHYVQE